VAAAWVESVSERVLFEVEGDVGLVTLNRPEKHNGMDFAMLDALYAVQKRVKKDRRLRAVIIRGDGPSFCAGLDVKAVFAQPVRSALRMLTLHSPVANRFQRWSMGWRDLRVPVIAVVHGSCFGAGLQLALGADVRIAAPDAKLSVMESKWGLIPDMGGAALLRELVPLDVAKELTWTGRILTAEEAHGLGLVTHVSIDPMAHARTLLAEINTRSPDAVAAGKALLQAAYDDTERGALAAERRWQWKVIGGKNQRIAIERNTRSPDKPYGPRRLS
jgi:enoyl-CoA hydratase/carnithine racemase